MLTKQQRALLEGVERTGGKAEFGRRDEGATADTQFQDELKEFRTLERQGYVTLKTLTDYTGQHELAKFEVTITAAGRRALRV